MTRPTVRRARLLAAGAGVALSAHVAAPAVTASTAAGPRAVRQTGVVVGTVADASTRAPLVSVEVRLPGAQLAARTDTAGRFHIAGVPRGTQAIVVRRLGYVADSAEVEVTADTARIDFELLAAPARLATTRVVDRAGELRLREFEDRVRARGGGSFVSGEVLAKSAGRMLGDVLRASMRGLSIASAPDGSQYAVSAREATSLKGALRPCPVKVFLNGMALGDSTLSNFEPGELAGAEYHDPSTAPVQYRRTGTQCGVLLLWSR